jgi:hypothetical protein
MFFDLNNPLDYELFTYENDIPDTIDILLIDKNKENDKTNFKIQLELDLWTGFPSRKPPKRPTKDNFYIISACHHDNDPNPNIIFNDFVFNRTKAYYAQYPFSKDTHRWHYVDHSAYIIPDITLSEKKNKIFISPGQTYAGRVYRRLLFDCLFSNYYNYGYIGNTVHDKKLLLYPQIDWPWGITLDELENTTRECRWHLGYLPPHNEYYKNTFISIYVESIEYGITTAISEKSLDPLIKGHFILPFSNPGYINKLLGKGFRLPTFIDYSYDNIENDSARYQAFENEVHRLLNLSLSTWQQLWNDNLDIIEHNRLVFHTKPYDKVDLKKLL